MAVVVVVVVVVVVLVLVVIVLAVELVLVLVLEAAHRVLGIDHVMFRLYSLLTSSAALLHGRCLNCLW